MKLTRKTLMERAGLYESLEGTLSFWNGKWRVSYTQPAGGDVRGDQAPELDASQVPYAVKNKAVIEKNRGMDVEFEIRNGKAFLLNLPVNEDTQPMYAQMVGSFGANFVGKRISVSNGESLHGGSFSGDYLVIGYGSIVKDASKPNLTKSDAERGPEILFIVSAGSRVQKIHSMLFHPKDIDNGKITITQ